MVLYRASIFFSITSALSSAVLMLSAKAALACHDDIAYPTAGSPECGGSGSVSVVPEISATGSIAAVTAVAAVGLLLWERRRRRSA